MNLVLPVVRHFVRLHGNPKMLLVSKKVLVLPISFEYHWIGIVGNPAETKRRCNDEKYDTNEIDNHVKWNARLWDPR